MATIKDVARAAGVSVSTVSHVLSGNRPISTATRLRVMDTITQLGYRPNQLAQGLVSKTTRSIGLLVPDLVNPFFSIIAGAMEVVAHDRGYSVILCNTNLDPAREADYLAVLLSRQVDGLIYFPGTRMSNPALTSAIDAAVPIVVVDERIDHLSGVFVDNFDGGRQLGSYLAGLGHRSILFIGGTEGFLTIMDRLAGLRAGLAEGGAPADAVHTSFGECRAAHGYAVVHAYAQEGFFAPDSPERITAVVGANDLIAFGALRALRELRLNVPGDCSLAGFDGIELTAVTCPSLTTVQQPCSSIATCAVELLLSAIETANDRAQQTYGNGASPIYSVSQIVLPVSLIVRESTAAPLIQGYPGFPRCSL